MSNLINISPIDGRYHEKTKELNEYFSEYALIKYRALVEIKWLLYLIEKDVIDESVSNEEKLLIESINDNFSIEDAEKVKDIEKITKHDVKACEYFLRDKFKEINLERLNPYIHITLTSEDVNNTSYNLMLKDRIKSLFKQLGFVD